MNEKELFLTLIIIGFVLGIIGFSAITGNMSGAAVYGENFVNNYHTKCVNGQCIELRGSGNSECDVDSHCSHFSCRGHQCIIVNEPGRNWCNSNIDCY